MVVWWEGEAFGWVRVGEVHEGNASVGVLDQGVEVGGLLLRGFADELRKDGFGSQGRVVNDFVSSEEETTAVFVKGQGLDGTFVDAEDLLAIFGIAVGEGKRYQF